MKVVVFALTVTVIVSGVSADACGDLCRTDPHCSNGSYNKNGFCHGLFYLPDTERTGICVHNSATRNICLSSFEKVPFSAAVGLLYARITTTVRPATTIVARPPRAVVNADIPPAAHRADVAPQRDAPRAANSAGSRVAPQAVVLPLGPRADVAPRGLAPRIAPAAVPQVVPVHAEVHANPPRRIEAPAASLVAPVAQSVSAWPASRLVPALASLDINRWADVVTLVREDLLAYEPRRVGNLEEFHNKWQRLGGPTLMRWFAANINSLPPNLMTRLVEAIMTLATNLDLFVVAPSNTDVRRLMIQQFAREIGLDQFCAQNAELVQLVASRKSPVSGDLFTVQRQLAMAREGRNNEYALEFAPAADWDIYCPDVFDLSRLRSITLRNRLARDIFSNDRFNGEEPIHVDRANAFEDSVHRLNQHVSYSRWYIKASFNNENGVGPGVRRDYFTEVAAQIYNPDFALFEFKEEAPHYTVISTMAEFQDNTALYYKAVGRFLGLAIINDIPVGVTFPIMFFAHILGVPLELADIAQDEPILYKSLSDISHMDTEVLADLGLELSINGEDIAITRDNRDELIRRKVNSLLSAKELAYIEHIKRGFLDMVPLRLLAGRISPKNLKDIVYGNPEIDIEDLRSNSVVAGYTKFSPQVVWLFNLLTTLNQADRAKFLRFVTSNSRLPLGGFAYLQTPLQIVRKQTGSDMPLPSTHTCFNQIDLPEYSTEAILRARVMVAINADAAMGSL